MSLVMSMELGQAATVTDVDGNQIEIEDELFTIYQLDQATFNDVWQTTDDRVMGGQSYSYSQFDKGVGLFNGTAVEEGGGFSMINTYRRDQTGSGNDMSTIPLMWDLS